MDDYTLNESYSELAEAIIMTAVYDWRQLCKQIIKPRKPSRNTDNRITFGTLRQFFNSSWCNTLSEIEPHLILDRLEQELEQARRNEKAQSRDNKRFNYRVRQTPS